MSTIVSQSIITRRMIGRMTIYLRERKTGRLIGCSNNISL